MFLNEYVKKDNQDSLIVVDVLRRYVFEIQDKINPEINIFSLFFHDIISITTGFIIKYNEINSRFKPDDVVLNYPVNNFPYISYKDIISSINIDDKIFNNKLNTVKANRINKILNIFKNKAKNTILTNIDVKEIFRLNIQHKSSKFMLCDERMLVINIENIQTQLESVSNLIEEIFCLLSINTYHNLLSCVISKHILCFYNKNEENSFNYDLFISGTMLKRENNIWAVKAALNNKPRITISHGEGESSLMDEPRYGYAESTYPSHILGYGKGGLDSQYYYEKDYVNGLFGNPSFIASNSKRVQEIYNYNHEIVSTKLFDDMFWMYVPDSMVYHNRYGPFCTISEKLYTQWQIKMISIFERLYYKRHPKGHAMYRKLKSKDIIKQFNINRKYNVKEIDGDFFEAHKLADGFIFDQITSAFMLACATDKPIIYFNIGKRNLHELAIKIVKQRVCWIDIDPECIDLKYDDIKKIFQSREYFNSVTEMFSLNAENPLQNRTESLSNLIHQII